MDSANVWRWFRDRKFVGARIAVLDFATNELLTTVNVESWGLAQVPGDNRLYATSMPDSNIAVIDTRSHTVVRAVRVGASPAAITIVQVEQ